MEKNKLFDWARGCDFAVTICNINGDIIYINDKSRATFAKYGNILGSNLKNCHSPRSWKIITELLATGGSNSYTITKSGKKKIIYQTPWYVEQTDAPQQEQGQAQSAGQLVSNGKIIGGLVEISIELPANMPHYDRDAEIRHGKAQ